MGNKIDVELIKEKIKNGTYSPNIFGTGSPILNKICNKNTNPKIQKSCYNLQKLFIEQIYVNYNKKINNMYCYSNNIEKKSEEHFEETDIKKFINKNIDVIMEQKKKDTMHCPLIVKEQENLLYIYKSMKVPEINLDIDMNYFGITPYQILCENKSKKYHCEQLNTCMRTWFLKFIKNNNPNTKILDSGIDNESTWRMTYHMYNLREPEETFSKNLNSMISDLDFIETVLNNEVEFNRDKIYKNQH